MNNLEDTQWCIFDLDHSNYIFSLNRESLNKIKNWEKIKTTIYHDSYLFKSKNDLKEWMKKELIIWLLWNNESEEQSEVIVKPYWKESQNVIIEISNSLIENLMNCKLNDYEYCFNSRGNKMNFYVNDSWKKEDLNERLNKLNKKFSNRED